MLFSSILKIEQLFYDIYIYIIGKRYYFGFQKKRMMKSFWEVLINKMNIQSIFF